jgi:hypothetical protein
MFFTVFAAHFYPFYRFKRGQRLHASPAPPLLPYQQSEDPFFPARIWDFPCQA